MFPHFQQIVSALAEKGIISVLHLDQDWTRDLEKLRELPAQKCILNLDGMTDIRKVKKVMDGHMAVLGDVPPDILSTGKPEAVDKYVKELINDIGTDGLLLCPGCDALGKLEGRKPGRPCSRRAGNTAGNPDNDFQYSVVRN